MAASMPHSAPAHSAAPLHQSAPALVAHVTAPVRRHGRAAAAPSMHPRATLPYSARRRVFLLLLPRKSPQARLAQFLTGSVLIIGGFMGVSLEPRTWAAWMQRWRRRRAGGSSGGGSSGGGRLSSSAAGPQDGGRSGSVTGRGQGLGGYDRAEVAAGPGGGGDTRAQLLGAGRAGTGLVGSGASLGSDARKEAVEEGAVAREGLGRSKGRGGNDALEGTAGGVAGRALRAAGQALGRGGGADGVTASYIPLTDKSHEGK